MSASSRTRRRSAARGLVAGALAGALALTAVGCGAQETGGSSGSAEPTVVEIEFADGEVTPNGERIEVGAGDPIELQVTADESGELHLHAAEEQTFAYGEGTETFEIQIDRPGVVVVESHDLGQVVVQLEVR